MIPSASLNPVNNKLSEKGSPAKINAETPGTFMDILNEFKQGAVEQDSNHALLAMADPLFQPTIESAKQAIPEEAEDKDQQTRNDLITLMSSLIENTIKPEIKVENMPKKQQENILLEKGTELRAETTAPAEESVQPKQESVQPKQQQPVIEAIQPTLSFRKSDLDTPGQFEGKEVIFQTVHPNNHATPAVKNEQIHPQKVSVDQLFTEVMDVVKNQASIKKSAEFIEAKFSLTPEKLGDIEVKLSIHKGQVLAHFSADTLLGKEALESQISQLRSSLQQQGLQVDKIEISLSGQGLHHSFSQQEGKSRQDQSQHRFSKKKISVDEFYQSHTVTEEYKQRGTENTINILA